MKFEFENLFNGNKLLCTYEMMVLYKNKIEKFNIDNRPFFLEQIFRFNDDLSAKIKIRNILVNTFVDYGEK